jgi:hypothetical protein
MMCWKSGVLVQSYMIVSVAGCLGYDVLVSGQQLKHIGFYLFVV